MPARPKRRARIRWRPRSSRKCGATAGRYRPTTIPRSIRPAASRRKSTAGSSAWEAAASCRKTPSNWPPPSEAVNRLVRAGENIVYVAEGSELLGVLGIQDALRENMKKAINRLRYTGIDDIVLLTGDVEQHAEIIADRMTVDRYRAEAMPDDKAETVLKLQSKGTHVVMVGDGINDAPALAYADVGIAMGGTRTDIAMEAADITVTGDDPLMIPAVIHLANRTMQTIRQNFAAAVGVNTLGLVLASIGVLPVFWGAVLHNSCTVGVVLNSSRLLFHDVERRLDEGDRKRGQSNLPERPGGCCAQWTVPSRGKPVVTVVHSLPGRVRARLSVAPRDVQRMLAGVREHPGMESISFTPVTNSVLARFNPHAISRRKSYCASPFSSRWIAAWRAGPALGGARAAARAGRRRRRFRRGAGRFACRSRTENGRGRSPTRWDWLAGLGTAGAVIDHAWKELRERGTFDPEVLSLAYLVTAFFRGNLLTASVVTWLASFGRHLVAVPPAGVQVRLVEVNGRGNGRSGYEMVIGPDVDAPERARMLGALQALLKYCNYRRRRLMPSAALLEELRDLSKVHGEVLEGSDACRRESPYTSTKILVIVYHVEPQKTLRARKNLQIAMEARFLPPKNEEFSAVSFIRVNLQILVISAKEQPL